MPDAVEALVRRQIAALAGGGEIVNLINPREGQPA